MRNGYLISKVTTLFVLIPVVVVGYFVGLNPKFFALYSGCCAAVISRWCNPELNDPKWMAVFLIACPVGMVVFMGSQKLSLLFMFFFFWAITGLALNFIGRKENDNDR